MDNQYQILERLSHIEIKLDALSECLNKSQEENKVKIGSNEYTLKKLPDGKVWMMENLREKVEGAVWNERYSCYMYTFDEAQKAVPEGFHLPSAKEFFNLALALGYLKDSEIEVAKKLQEECGFVFSGSTDDCESLGDLGSSGSFWSSTQKGAPYSYRFVFYWHSVYPIEPTVKDYRMAVRLIKD